VQRAGERQELFHRYATYALFRRLMFSACRCFTLLLDFMRGAPLPRER